MTKPGTKQVTVALVSCQLCEKSFRKRSKLQRHLLQDHPVDVTILRGRSPIDRVWSEEQRKADEGVQEALAAANKAMACNIDGKGVCCPQCLPQKMEKLFLNVVDLASHMIGKHNIISSDSDSDGDDEGTSDREQKSTLISEPCVSREYTNYSKLDECTTEVSEKKLLSKRTLPGSTEMPVKRTKLLCVDVTNDGAVPPVSSNVGASKALVMKVEPVVAKREENGCDPPKLPSKRHAADSSLDHGLTKKAKCEPRDTQAKLSFPVAEQKQHNSCLSENESINNPNVAGDRNRQHASQTLSDRGSELSLGAVDVASEQSRKSSLISRHGYRANGFASIAHQSPAIASPAGESNVVAQTSSCDPSSQTGMNPDATATDIGDPHSCIMEPSAGDASSPPQRSLHPWTGSLSLDFTDPFNP